MVNEERNIEEAERLAGDLHTQGHPFWPRPLVDELERAGKGAALEWAVELFSRSLSCVTPQSLRDENGKFLAEASAMMMTKTQAHRCHELAGTIWTAEGKSSLFQRGISRLFTGLGCLLSADLDEYERQVISSVALLADHVDRHGECCAGTFESAIALMREMLENGTDEGGVPGAHSSRP